MKKIIFSILILLAVQSIAQTPEEVREIVSHYDMKLLKEKEAYYRQKHQNEKRKAEAVAQINGWPIVIENADGSREELMRLTPDGYPVYYKTDNVNAAKATRANQLHTGGAMGLNLNGQGMTVRVWDGGNVRASHNAFGGRVTVVDEPSGTLNSHSTHVTGTMVASANPASVKGMAPQANARTFEWTDDSAEVLSEVQLGMLVSNHSYGVPISSGTNTLPGWIVGAYITDSYEWDEIAYLSPYYLQVASAGNEGDSNANSDPLLFGYDKLTTNKTCKNNLVVANCLDVTVDTNGNVTSSIDINSSSSQGPTDDLRIKPDITGNGTGLTSTNSTGNSATISMSGTSMSSPNVAGTLILLQQHYNNLYNSYMRAATLKGLACHTADDAGETGPDPVFGWGLLNAKKAAQTISGNGVSSWISEENLNQGQSFSMTVNATGTEPLIASITWTDLPGAMNTSSVPNDYIKALVNDLDIRITRNSTTYYPWRLSANPALPALNNGDNDVDNVEQVKIATPTAGQYTITVTHKGNLVTNSQKYSLVITGISSAFAINSTSSDLTLCANQNATFTFTYTQSGTGTTTFSAAGLPSGASASFSPTSLSGNGTVTMTITGLSNVTPGEYFVGITGSNGTETETRLKSLRIYSSTFTPVSQQSPAQAQTGLSTSTILRWAAQPNAETYNVQVAMDPTFTTIAFNDTTSETQYYISGLSQQTRYYWRIIPSNRCGSATAASATVRYFDTGVITCDQTFTATDFSDASIASVANSSASVPLTITGGYTIGDLLVNLDITHTYVQDMTITLEGPAAIGSPVIRLLQEPCGDNDNINCTFDDDGGEPACSGNPSISGLIAPLDQLSTLNTLPADGVWTLRVNDPWNGDGGTINAFSMNLCRITPALATTSQLLSNVSIYPNPANTLLTVSLPENTLETQIVLYDLQGREIVTKTTNAASETLALDNIQEGVYLISIQNDNGTASKKVIIKR